MKDPLDQRLINSRPDDHPANTDFVKRTMEAVKINSAHETFSHATRKTDTTKKESFIMKLRSLPKPALLAIAIIAVMAISGTAYAAYHAAQKTSKPTPHTTQQPAIDPTKDWKPYTSVEGKFSLRYPGEWIEIQNAQNCPGYFGRGATEMSRGICQSDALSQIIVYSVEGDETVSRVPNPQNNTDIQTSTISVGSVQGKKYTSKSKGQEFNSDGTRQILYLFFANGRTYIAQYNDGGGKFKNVEKEFNLMITKTLSFTAPATSHPPKPVTNPKPRPTPMAPPSPTTQPRKLHEPDIPGAAPGAAGSCYSPPPNTSQITVTVYQAGYPPYDPGRCIRVSSSQTLKIVNGTKQKITGAFADFYFSVEPGASYSVNESFGSYLKPGGHRLSFSHLNSTPADIWLE